MGFEPTEDLCAGTATPETAITSIATNRCSCWGITGATDSPKARAEQHVRVKSRGSLR
jgi:hypothetical protein